MKLAQKIAGMFTRSKGDRESVDVVVQTPEQAFLFDVTEAHLEWEEGKYRQGGTLTLRADGEPHITGMNLE